MDSSQTPRYAVVIDDDSDIRQLLVDVLTQAGFQAIPTSNGLDGLAAVRRFDPIVTTLDVNMPGMDGFAVAKRLREFSNTYPIMITALADEIDVVQGFEAGADDYLVKPFRPRELRARADSMLRRPRARMDKPHGWVDPEPEPQPAAPPAPASWAAAAARDLAETEPLAPLPAQPAPPAQPVQQPAQPVQQPAPPAPAAPVAPAQPAYQPPPVQQPAPVAQPAPVPVPQSVQPPAATAPLSV